MIFPAHCKEVGYAGERFAGDQVYFLSRWLIHETAEGPEIIEVTLKEGKGMMRNIAESHLIAGASETSFWPERVCLHDRGGLIEKALSGGARCTLFKGEDEHMTFICDPDPDALLNFHVYDITPPRPNLAETLRALDAAGLFGELEIRFEYHIRDIRETGADVYPCRASGCARSIDNDPVRENETVAGCITARQVLAECYGGNYTLIDICPANAACSEPYIARCCRSEREGTGTHNDLFGGIVHWGASPRQIAECVFSVVREWRKL